MGADGVLPATLEGRRGGRLQAALRAAGRAKGPARAGIACPEPPPSPQALRLSAKPVALAPYTALKKNKN